VLRDDHAERGRTIYKLCERDRAHQNVKLLISGCPANKVKRGNLVLMTLDSKKAPQFGGRQPWVGLWVIARG
jgi:hypothetical protein